MADAPACAVSSRPVLTPPVAPARPVPSGDLLLEFAEQQLQLLDRATQLLRRGAEPLAQQLREAPLQLLVAQHLLPQPIARRLQFARLLFQRGRMFRLALQQQAA